MKRLIIAIALFLGLIAPVQAFKLLALPVTTAISTASPNFQFRAGQETDLSIIIQCSFAYGSGGTSVDAYIQTSIDGGANWIDVVNCHFTTSSLRNLYNISGVTPKTTAVVPTDGTLASNTAIDGFVGSIWRVKYVTVGTYVGTVLNIDVGPNRMTPSP